MASGNSGGSNIQSSSSGGGDEEYDSRTESISSILNKNPTNFASFTSSPPFPPNQNLASFYNNSHIIPSPQNLDHFPPSTTPNFQYNNISDGSMIWSAGFRSEANSTDHTLRNQSLQASSQANATRPTSQPEVTKNPKKRTRASRRAPTTVLTTDTTNFRQMVQEFTGIPTAPFPGSPYPRRMNLLSGASAFRPGAHLGGLGPLYSLRPPISQNMVSPFSSSSSSSPSVFNATTIDAIVSSTNIVTTSNKTSYAAAVLGDISSNNPNNSPLLNSDQALLNLQQHHHNSSLNPSLHGHRFEASGSIDFGNYLGDFRNHEISNSGGGGAGAGDLKINDGNITVWTSGQSVKNDDGIQEKFMTFDGKI